MKNLNKRPDTLAYAVMLAAGLCANNAFATSSVASRINQICQAAGNPMIVSTNSCTACHNDGDGGSGAGKTAARGSNATILSFFCPDAVVTPPPAPTCTDADGDGYTVQGGSCGTQMDCNDNNAAIYPGAAESCTDGVDNNCNNRVDAQDSNAVGCPVDNCTDADGDGYSVGIGNCGPVDCNDADAGVNPGTIELCDDGFDNNCDANIDAADAACQAMTSGDDPVLEERHEEERRRRGGYSGYYYDREDDDDESRGHRSSQRSRRDGRDHD